MTQEELGKLVGVQKAQISTKLENSANSATIDTVLKVFKALKSEINFNVKLEYKLLNLPDRKENRTHNSTLEMREVWFSE